MCRGRDDPSTFFKVSSHLITSKKTWKTQILKNMVISNMTLLNFFLLEGCDIFFFLISWSHQTNKWDQVWFKFWPLSHTAEFPISSRCNSFPKTFIILGKPKIDDLSFETNRQLKMWSIRACALPLEFESLSDRISQGRRTLCSSLRRTRRMHSFANFPRFVSPFLISLILEGFSFFSCGNRNRICTILPNSHA